MQDNLWRLNAICPYYTMFPLEFPMHQLKRARHQDWVLDPFCGRGTTNFAARLSNLPSVGVDSNPVAVAIASAKFVNIRSVDDIVGLCRSILAQKREPRVVPQGRFWSLCYHPKTLEGICKLREELLRDCSTQERLALRALALGILHGPRQKGAPSYLSNQMPRTYATKSNPAVAFWLKKKLYPVDINVLEVVERRARYLFADLPPEVMGFALQADSRALPFSHFPMRFCWVITSPPYLGMRSYGPDQWLRNWFIGGPAEVVYTQKGQLHHHPKEEFVRGLSNVWRSVSVVCLAGARLIVRFGALPSQVRDPLKLLKQSIEGAACGWHVQTVKRAGQASQGKRQADQFGGIAGSAVEEFDLHAVLEG